METKWFCSVIGAPVHLPVCLTLYIHTVGPESCLHLLEGNVKILVSWAFLHLGQSPCRGAETFRTLGAHLLLWTAVPSLTVWFSVKTPRAKWRCVLRFYLRGACPVELFLEQRQCIERFLNRQKTIVRETVLRRVSLDTLPVWLLFGAEEQTHGFIHAR